MMSDLITLSRAKTSLANLTTTTTEDATLGTLIQACSSAVGAYCGQDFVSTLFDELVDGSDTDVLLLRRYPIVEIQRVAANPVPVLRVRNSGGNARASVAVRSTGMRLTRVTAGVTTIDDTVTWSSYPTLALLATAISALGNGWEAATFPGYGGWAAADLFAPAGAYACLDTYAMLRLHRDILDDWELHPDNGWLHRLGCDGVGWPAGKSRYRVRYQAGYASVPADVQEACAQWVAALFYQTQTNPGTSPILPPDGVRRLLLPHRRIRL